MNPARAEHRLSKCLRLVALVSASLTVCGITAIANDVPSPTENDEWVTIDSHVPDKPQTNSATENQNDLGAARLAREQGAKASLNCGELYILVSTIDGKVTALDLHNQGSQMWSVEADTRPLYSSSLANMEIIRNGKKLRVIPSLDGALYQYDGEKVEAVPMSAETLLSNTYRLSDDAMVVGSKDIRNYGVDVKTGEIQYTCGSEGCTTKPGQTEAGGGSQQNTVVVLTRTTQVVRSVDIKNGVEKWNFSVGQHQVNFPPPTKRAEIDADDSEEDSGDYVGGDEQAEGEWPWMAGSHSEKCSTLFPEDIDIEDYLRLIVPEGKVIALGKEDTARVRWEHKFDSPIAKAWLLRHGRVEPMNLFDGRHLPTLGTAFEPDDLENESMHQPLLYIGSHQKLLYIQPSPRMEAMLESLPTQRIGHVFDSSIKVSWRPYLNTASVRTPIFGGNRPAISEDVASEKLNNRGGGSNPSSNALAVWHEDYPFDTGYFLYPDFMGGKSSGRVKKGLPFGGGARQRQGDRLADGYESVWSSLAHYIGYMVVLVVGVLSYLSLVKPQTVPAVQEVHLSTADTSSLTDSQLISAPDTHSSSAERQAQAEFAKEEKEVYVSRFATDFECLQCLGKGGFGIVFEAVHRFDNSHYAVKRTMLPAGEKAREKVLREARLLAKLEHRGITRYNNAWVESPPPGWQEEVDKRFLANTELSGMSFSLKSYSTDVCGGRGRKAERILPDQTREASLSTTDSGMLVESDDLFNNVRWQSDRLTSTQSGQSGEFTVNSGSNNNSLEVPGLESTGCDTDSWSNNSNMAWMPPPNTPGYSLCGDRDRDMTETDSIVFEESSVSVADPRTIDPFDLTATDSIVFEESEGHSNKDTHLLSKIQSVARDHTTVDISVSRGTCDQLDTSQHSLGPQLAPPQRQHFLYIQMQLYRKETLKDWLNNNPTRDSHKILSFFVQLVEAVDYLHNQRLMHRDLKPSNIFFSDDMDQVKVGDFGLVTSLDVEQTQQTAEIGATRDCDILDTSLVSSGGQASRHTAEVGTTLYMSPEQISKQAYNFKVDIFSLGLILMELCIPFSTQMERIRSILDVKRQVFPQKLMTDWPEEYHRLVQEMTHPSPSHRPATHDILQHELITHFYLTNQDRVDSRQRSRSRTISNNSNS